MSALIDPTGVIPILNRRIAELEANLHDAEKACCAWHQVASDGAKENASLRNEIAEWERAFDPDLVRAKKEAFLFRAQLWDMLKTHRAASKICRHASCPCRDIEAILYKE